MFMTSEEMLRLLWAIFIAEGASRASVPFGWIKRKAEWKAKQISFQVIMAEVIYELKHEYRKWAKSREKEEGWDFIRWLARKGYNANPAEWDEWEKNVRYFYNWLRKGIQLVP
jgi:hypothetical protein